jgi:hypothetical protein
VIEFGFRFVVVYLVVKLCLTGPLSLIKLINIEMSQWLITRKRKRGKRIIDCQVRGLEEERLREREGRD